MNYISETGRRYDIARHVKRTSKYFSPSGKIVFDNTSDEEDHQLKENEVDATDILLEGNRQPDQLISYLKTSEQGIVLPLINDYVRANLTMLLIKFSQ
jgi:hypothetical protein